SEAIAKAVIAGVDMFMVSEKWKTFLELLTSLVQNGSVPMSRIDDAVSRILRVKFAAGLFDKPQPSKRHLTNQSSYGTKYHREISREAVRKSLVLLKNENEILPLDKNLRLLVAGKNAHDRGNQCGGWSISWQGTSGNDHIEGGTSIWEGIQKVAPNAVLSSDGAEADPAYHDAAVVVIGETPYAEGFGDIRDGDRSIIEVGSRIRGRINPLEPYGKTLQLSKLHPEDLKTILNITNKGIPTVVILITGRPLIINKELREADAFITAWLPGSEGQGIADVIFGDFNFQGKLSFSWPEHEDDNYNRGDDEYHPLFEYGFGMTYSDRKIEQQQAQ
ncbi:MAG: beta-glucosidase, partial [Gammaproteobacteria bacterium]